MHVPTRAKTPYPGFVIALSNWENYCSPLDGMLVNRRVTPLAVYHGTHLYI